jgi:hypothetical protein
MNWPFFHGLVLGFPAGFALAMFMVLQLTPKGY